MSETIFATARAMRRYTDWRGWFTGMYLASIPASIGKVAEWLTTNGVEATGISYAQGTGMSLKQFGVMFATAILLNAALYVKANPKPEELTRPITPAPFLPKP